MKSLHYFKTQTLFILCVFIFSMGYSQSSQSKMKKEEVIVARKILKTYAGKYKMGPENILEVTIKDKQIFLVIPNAGTFELFAESESTFFVKDIAAIIDFIKGEDGMIEKISLTSDSVDKAPRMKTGKGYAGKYKMGEDNILEVSTVDNQVFLEIPKAGKFELFKKGGAADTFYPKAFEATIAFNKNEKGEVTSISIISKDVNVASRMKN